MRTAPRILLIAIRDFGASWSARSAHGVWRGPDGQLLVCGGLTRPAASADIGLVTALTDSKGQGMISESGVIDLGWCCRPCSELPLWLQPRADANWRVGDAAMLAPKQHPWASLGRIAAWTSSPANRSVRGSSRRLPATCAAALTRGSTAKHSRTSKVRMRGIGSPAVPGRLRRESSRVCASGIYVGT